MSQSPNNGGILWCVHVRGPDDIVPVASYDDAVRLSDSINWWWASIKLRDTNEPIISAIPAIYPHAVEKHTEWVAKLGTRDSDYAIPTDAQIEVYRMRAFKSRLPELVTIQPGAGAAKTTTRAIPKACDRCNSSGEIGVATRGAREKPGPVPDDARGYVASTCPNCRGTGVIDCEEEDECVAVDMQTKPASGTPAAKWRLNGEPDPHGNRYDCERAELIGGHMTDDELANHVFMDGDGEPDIAPGLPAREFGRIRRLTAAKDRIRWLSRKLGELDKSEQATFDISARLLRERDEAVKEVAILGVETKMHRAGLEAEVQEVEKLQAEIATLRSGSVAPVVEAASVVLASIDSLVSESEGVTGLHKNGDVAPWEEILDDGRYPCLELAPLRSALTAAFAHLGGERTSEPQPGPSTLTADTVKKWMDDPGVKNAIRNTHASLKGKPVVTAETATTSEHDTLQDLSMEGRA